MLSEPLFTNIVGEDSAPVKSLSINDLLSNSMWFFFGAWTKLCLIFLDVESTQLPSPTKNIAGDHNWPTDCKSYITNGHKFTHFILAMASNTMTLQNMPDPDGVYSAMSQNSTSPTYVKNPNICGSDRDIIPASDYGTVLKQGMIFLVEGYLKMYPISSYVYQH